MNSLPPEYNHMQQILGRIGFTGGKIINTKQRGYQIVELDDKDFDKIAELLIQQATAGKRGIVGGTSFYEEYKRIYGRD